jgi:hypothetical protein
LAEFGEDALTQFAAQAQQTRFNGLGRQALAGGKFLNGCARQIFSLEQGTVIGGELRQAFVNDRSQAVVIGGG